MQQTADRETKGVPGLGQLPVLGNLFNQRNDTTGKTELVVFLRPVVVDRQDPLPADSRDALPDGRFFQPAPDTVPAELQPVPLQDRRS
jgi:general secretion pathway protein D